MPLAFVQTRSTFLASVGPVQATDAARRVVDSLGVIEAEPTVSRIDLTADFTSSMAMDSWGRSAWITRAEHRHAHAMGDNFSGWSIGLGGPVAFRLYDKLLEIVTRSNKAYLFPLWQQRGWFPGDQVWRAEFQLRRPVLAQFGLTTLPETLNAIPCALAVPDLGMVAFGSHYARGREQSTLACASVLGAASAVVVGRRKFTTDARLPQRQLSERQIPGPNASCARVE